MKLTDAARSSDRLLRLNPIGQVTIGSGEMVRLTITPRGLLLSVQGYTGACSLPDVDDADWLESVLPAGRYLAEVISAGKDEVNLQVLAYDALERWPDGRELGVDEVTVEDVNKHRNRNDDVTAVVEWLSKQLVPDGKQPFAVISTGGGAAINESAFRIIGSTIVADVALENDRLLITGVTRRVDSRMQRMTLALGKVSVQDATRVAAVNETERQEIRRLAEADNAYLAIWKEYNALERANARDAARDIGWAEYDRFRVLADGGLEFELVRHAKSDALRKRIQAEQVGLEAGDGVAFDDDDARAVVIGTAVLTPRGSVVIHPDRPYESGTLPQRGRLAGAYSLDKVRVSRRERAQEVISYAATGPTRQMSRILADQRPEPVRVRGRHKALSAKVQKILGGNPTDAQLQAIDLAINSRDVVLIQGPPGTGKTRVIAAIQARLAEINKGYSALERRVLLASYQHDAVENLVLAADDGALPPVKLGRSEGVDDQSYLKAWTAQLHERLTARFEASAPNAAVRSRRALVDRAAAYRDQPFDIRDTVGLLLWLADQDELISPEIAHESHRLARKLDRQLGAATTTVTQREVARRARALRSTPEGFADDGRLTAAEALSHQELYQRLDDRERDVMERIAWGEMSPEEAPGELAAIKASVLDRLLDARARANVVAARADVEAMLQRALDAADAEVKAQASPVELAVERFRDAVEHQPGAIRHSVQQHTRALAATCQQAVSGSVREAQAAPFDTVIIDEAARANPLDLMIPMSLAKERIILVGDHRQLPQLLDEALVPGLSTRHDPEVVNTVLSRSMFERLFEKLRDAESNDGTKRVVTLDRQFRTHPVLGTFISDQFYAPYGERLLNGNPDPSSYSHNLEAYAGSVCGWIDVPLSHGGEIRSPLTNSVSRPVEAKTIVAELAPHIQNSADLTFGVIAFYSGQVTAIWEEMVLAGLAIRGEHGYELNESVPTLFSRHGVPRIRIGSVDAFQGREFDVVYLSVTRAQQPGRNRGNPFGFLVLPNRLCVAMSRQRRLLIAVGDSATVISPTGRAAVPSLAAFYDLTGGGHGFRRSL